MIVVTGAAGFIGSCVVSELNKRGYEDLILVDHLDKDGLKKKNLEGKKYVEYHEKQDFLEKVNQCSLPKDVSCIMHMGACSSTTLQDAEYFSSNNLEYTRTLAKWALENDVRFIYASSAATYGDGSLGYKDDDDITRRCKPLNLYGQSKQDFDLWALDEGLFDKIIPWYFL